MGGAGIGRRIDEADVDASLSVHFYIFRSSDSETQKKTRLRRKTKSKKLWAEPKRTVWSAATTLETWIYPMILLMSLWTPMKLYCHPPHEAEGEEVEGGAAGEEGEVSYHIIWHEYEVKSEARYRYTVANRCAKGLFKSAGLVVWQGDSFRQGFDYI